MITTHQLRFIEEVRPTAEEAAFAFVRAHDDIPTGHARIWALSSNDIVATRAQTLLDARMAMAREGGCMTCPAALHSARPSWRDAPRRQASTPQQSLVAARICTAIAELNAVCNEAGEAGLTVNFGISAGRKVTTVTPPRIELPTDHLAGLCGEAL